jgi:hypothetical protein
MIPPIVSKNLTHFQKHAREQGLKAGISAMLYMLIILHKNIKKHLFSNHTVIFVKKAELLFSYQHHKHTRCRASINVCTDSGIPMDTRGSFSGGKVAGT